MSETRIPEALALLREKGWCKGMQRDNQGRHCIVGALGAVHTGLMDDIREDAGAVQRAITAQYRPLGITVFNDDPATTFADVERVMEKAALERGGAL